MYDFLTMYRKSAVASHTETGLQETEGCRTTRSATEHNNSDQRVEHV